MTWRSAARRALMSHKYGPGCRRKPTHSMRRFCSSCGSADARRFPGHITLDGESLEFPTRSYKSDTDRRQSGARRHAWDHWVVRGVCRDREGNYHPTRWGRLAPLWTLHPALLSQRQRRPHCPRLRFPHQTWRLSYLPQLRPWRWRFPLPLRHLGQRQHPPHAQRQLPRRPLPRWWRKCALLW